MIVYLLIKKKKERKHDADKLKYSKISEILTINWGLIYN